MLFHSKRNPKSPAADFRVTNSTPEILQLELKQRLLSASEQPQDADSGPAYSLTGADVTFSRAASQPASEETSSSPTSAWPSACGSLNMRTLSRTESWEDGRPDNGRRDDRWVV